MTIYSERSPLESVFILRVVALSSESDSMRSTAKPPAMHILASRSSTFSSFPVELLTSVFCHFPSFREVFILSSTCRQLRDVWLDNVAIIYNHVARDSILYERHTGNFLAAQGGSSPDSEITSAKDAVGMMKNMHVIVMPLLQFECQIVHRVKARGHRAEDYYGADAVQHPSYLTRTERPRFIRSYYQLWGLMKVNLAEWRSRLQYMMLKQLLHLREMSRLPDSIERGEEMAPPPRHPDAEPDSHFAIDDQWSKERNALSKMILEQTEKTYRDIHGE